MDDGFNGSFGLNQDETMRIDAATMESPELCTSNSSSEEVYIRKILYVRSIHMARLYQMNMEIQNE